MVLLVILSNALWFSVHKTKCLIEATGGASQCKALTNEYFTSVSDHWDQALKEIWWMFLARSFHRMFYLEKRPLWTRHYWSEKAETTLRSRVAPNFHQETSAQRVTYHLSKRQPQEIPAVSTPRNCSQRKKSAVLFSTGCFHRWCLETLD